MDVVVLELRDFAHLDRVDLPIVVLAGLHGVQSGVGVGDKGPHHLVDPRVFRPPPIVVVAHDPDVLPGPPLGELEGSRADQLVSAVERHIVDDLSGRHVPQNVLRENGLEDPCVVAPYAVPSEDDGLGVGHEAFEDREVEIPVVHGRAFAGYESPGEAHVLTGERLTVVPAHALVQLPGHVDRSVVVPDDETILFGGDFLGEDRDVDVVLVRRDEALDHAEVHVH